MSKNRTILFILVVLLQIGILAWIALTNQRVLFMGEPLLLKTVPVDPQDPFRGDYVVLNYEMSRLDLNKLKHDPSVESIEQDDTLYVSFKQDGEFATPSYVSAEIPSDSNDPVVKGRVLYGWSDCNGCSRSLQVEYGIEQFFTPQGEAIEIERAPTDSITVQIRAMDNGEARIEKVLKNGKEITY